ncbi:MAG: hypothetical protein EA391_14700 [Balneolaceae bacterium]|nr:MAG: hypothetical protein EA391_14700 [Balneolaceae bacterium]
MAHYKIKLLIMSFKLIINKILILLILTSCSHLYDDKKQITVDALDFEPELTVKEHSFKEVTGFYSPAEIINVNDKYLLLSDGDDEGIIKVFTLPEIEFLYSWGTRGQGPDEFQHIPLNEINTKNENVIFYEIGSRKLMEYFLSDSTLIFINDRELSYRDQTNSLTGITKVKNDFYIAERGPDFGEYPYEFIALTPDESTPKFSFGEFPESELTGFEKLFEFHKTTAASDNGSKIAAFYMYHNQFKYFDNTGNLVGSFLVNDHLINPTGNESKFQFRSVKEAYDSFIYVMGINEFGNLIEEQIETFRPSLEIWDWEGNQVYRAKFSVPIHNFTVSEEHGRIYAYSILNPYSIYEFEIPTDFQIHRSTN